MRCDCESCTVRAVIGKDISYVAFTSAMRAHRFHLEGKDLVHASGLRLRGDLKTVAGTARLVQEMYWVETTGKPNDALQETENLYIVCQAPREK